MRTYTVDDGMGKRLYQGFSSYPQTKGDPSPFIGVVMFDGDPDIWSLDKDAAGLGANRFAISELQRYYWEQYDRIVKVKVYKQDTEF